MGLHSTSNAVKVYYLFFNTGLCQLVETISRLSTKLNRIVGYAVFLGL